MNTLTRANNDDWYNALIEECKAIIVETEFTARWALVEGYHQLGTRILEENNNFERNKIYGQEIVQRVGISLGKNPRNIYYALQFAKKYPDLDQVPEGKAISWSKLRDKYLPNRASQEQDILNGGSISLHEGVLHGDLFDELPKLKQKSVDMIYADPPYNANKDEWDTFVMEEYEMFTVQWLKHCLKVLKDQAHLFIHFSADKATWLENLIDKEYHLQPSDRIIWHYRNLVQGRDSKTKLLNTYQPVLHYGFGNKPLNFSEEWTEERFDVWTIATPQTNFKEGKDHITQKPLALMERIVGIGSKPTELVLDPFAGSGTTAVACKTLQRSFITIEKEDKYIPIIQRRLNDLE